MQRISAVGLLDAAKLSRFHYLLVFWCSFIMLFDGYDLVFYGSVLPHLMTEWNLTASQAGMLGSSSMLGMMVGAVLLGTTADRFGGRPIIFFCVVLFSLAAFGNAFAVDAATFAICRFLTGVGLGGVVPNLVTILKEMAPPQYRNRLINRMRSLFAVGGLSSALAGIYLIPMLGWHSPFYVAGLSLLCLPLLYKTLPESVAYLVYKNRHDEVGKLLQRTNSSHRHAKDVQYEIESVANTANSSIASLFSDARAFATFMVWVAFGMCMLIVYGFSLPLEQNFLLFGLPGVVAVIAELLISQRHSSRVSVSTRLKQNA
ncbi:hypothetical protein KNHN1_11570 [Pseudomonas guariconensis]|uniref:MFS transporter n=1 Tax=Pseudomonas guariconensis TaxID=1288410 RepID=UPI0036F1C5B9